MATTLTQAPAEPTNGDVMIAIETLRNAGAAIRSEPTRITITLDFKTDESS